MATPRTKSSDKQAVFKKLIPLLKKRYKPAPPPDRPVLQTMLYAVCLENASQAEADKSYARLESDFHDLNEIRVSSVTELEPVFAGRSEPDWRAYRVRNILQYVFEKNFNYEFEGLKKKNLELASKQLAKIKGLSPFVRNYTLQAALGVHLIPVDDAMANALRWLGLSEPDATPEKVGESLKSVILKAEAPTVCNLLRSLATDPALREAFDPGKNPPPPEGFDPSTALERLNDLFESATKAKPSRSTSTKKAAGDAKTVKKAAKKEGKTGSRASRAGSAG